MIIFFNSTPNSFLFLAGTVGKPPESSTLNRRLNPMEDASAIYNKFTSLIQPSDPLLAATLENSDSLNDTCIVSKLKSTLIPEYLNDDFSESKDAFPTIISKVRYY